jgi:hypothetical protein
VLVVVFLRFSEYGIGPGLEHLSRVISRTPLPFGTGVRA